MSFPAYTRITGSEDGITTTLSKDVQVSAAGLNSSRPQQSYRPCGLSVGFLSCCVISSFFIMSRTDNLMELENEYKHLV